MADLAYDEVGCDQDCTPASRFLKSSNSTHSRFGGNTTY